MWFRILIESTLLGLPLIKFALFYINQIIIHAQLTIKNYWAMPFIHYFTNFYILTWELCFKSNPILIIIILLWKLPNKFILIRWTLSSCYASSDIVTVAKFHSFLLYVGASYVKFSHVTSTPLIKFLTH
jgi:hypothetical protein